ncbi:MAG: oligosaccharide flippase family protein [Paraglaciecola sp.]|nr:oligosaccharide flippase family protein [Paraglaciecola sp.]
MSSIRSGLIFAFAGKYGLKVINLLSTVLIARLLSPAEIGTFAIASSVVMILAEVKLLGASVYLIRADNVDENKIRKAYGLTFLMCWSIALLLIFGSGSISAFFNQSSLQNVFIILALSFFLAPYISIPDALLARRYLFKTISAISLISVVLQLIVTIVLINYDYSFYALAWGQLIGMLSRMLLSLYFTRDIKVYIPSFKGLGEIAKLGIYTSAAHVLRRFNYTAADLVIGKMGTPTEVGLFSRGMGYIDFVSQSVLDGVGAISQPYMSDMKRKGSDISNVYIKATVLLCSVLWPILIVAGIAALPAIRLLFGTQWDVAAPIAFLLSIWLSIKVMSFLAPSLLIAFGEESIMFKRDIFLFFLLLSLLIYFYQYGIAVLPFAFLINALVELLLTIIILSFKVNLSLKSFFLALTKPLLLTICCLVTVKVVDYYFDFAIYSPIGVFLLLLVIMPPVWLVVAKLLNLTIYFEVKNVLTKVKLLNLK